MAFTFSIKLKNKPQIEFKSVKNYNRIIMGDDIRKFYPTASINIKDTTGFFSEIMGLIEGSEWTFTYGDSEDLTNQIIFDSVWKTNQLTDFYHDYFVSGHNTIDFISKYYMNDYSKSKSYQGKISDVIKQVIASYSYKDMLVEDTMNNGIWGQGLISDKDFINELKMYSNSVNHGNEPMFAFIDVNGRFHYETISNMLTVRKPVIELSLQQGNDTKYDISVVNDLDLIWGDLEKDYENYNAKYFYFDLNADEMKNEEKKITDIVGSTGKVPILKNNTNDTKSNRFFGFVNPNKETNKNKDMGTEEYKGWMASHYKNQQTWLIMRVVMKGAIPQAQTGQVVSTKFKSVYSKRGFATEFTGNWAVIKSSHMLTKDYVPFTELFISRPYIDFNQDNLFKSELL